MLLSELFEGRREELAYEEKKVKGQLDRVILSLQGNQSGKFTRLISRYKKLQKAVEKLQEHQALLNADIKEEVEDLFNADDEVLTRVVDTISATLTLSKKQSVRTEKVDYALILEKLVALVPELEEQVKLLVEEHTKITVAEKSPALRTTIKEGLKDWGKKIKEIAKQALKTAKNWGKSYDSELAEVKELISNLK